MDGTLTLPIHDFESIRKELGIKSGSPILEAIRKMPQQLGDKANKLLHDLEMELARNAQPQPQIKQVLNTLLTNGCKLGILTRNGKEISETTLAATGLSKYFTNETIISREECEPKPSPEGVHKLLDIWCAPKEETVIVGDYLYDIEAGFLAGINTVHFDHQGVFQWPEFTNYKITRADQLLSLI